MNIHSSYNESTFTSQIVPYTFSVVPLRSLQYPYVSDLKREGGIEGVGEGTEPICFRLYTRGHDI